MTWICDGIPKDGRQYPNAPHPNQPYVNHDNSPTCAFCGLPKAAMQLNSGTRSGTRQGLLLAGSSIGTAAVAIAAGMMFWTKSQPISCPTGQTLVNNQCIAQASPCPTGQTSVNGQCISSPAVPLTCPTLQATSSSQGMGVAAPVVAYQTPERFSSGERVLFRYRSNYSRDRGVEKFQVGDYVSAASFFQQAVQGSPNDPEPQIYLNNANARQRGKTLKIAVALPIDNKSSSAEEILRGVADAQTHFNDLGGVNNQLLEVVIANDSNEIVAAGTIAQQLACDPNVLAVIGHNSSDTSQAALSEYTKADLAMVSPTSTSTALTSSVFFRTVPSDQVTGRKLAECATALNSGPIATFYDSKSIYTSSLYQAFTTSLKGQQLPPVDLTTPGLNVNGELSRLRQQGGASLVTLLPSTATTSVAIAIARTNAQLPRVEQLQLLGADALYTPATLIDGGEAIDGLILAVPWFAHTPAAQTYANKAEQRWAGQVSWRTALSYDATQAVIHALYTSSSRIAVLQQLRQVHLSAQETSGEDLQFAANGDRIGEPVIVKATRGSGGPFGSNYMFRVTHCS